MERGFESFEGQERSPGEEERLANKEEMQKATAFLGKPTEKDFSTTPFESKKEATLRNTTIVDSKLYEDRRNPYTLVRLEDGTLGIFKPGEREKNEYRGLEAGTFFKRERAAYLVDQFLRFGLVPPTVIRTIEGETGSFQEMITNAPTCENLSKKEKKILKVELMRLWIFDFIIGNADRKGGDILYRDGKIFAVDHGLSFAANMSQYPRPKELMVYETYFDAKLPREIPVLLYSFLEHGEEQEMLRKLLGELLTKEEVEACFDRIHFAAGILSENGGKIPSEYEWAFATNVKPIAESEKTTEKLAS